MSRKYTAHFCPACPVLRPTQREIILHAKEAHGLSKSEATGGWMRPADWDRFANESKTRKFRDK